MTDWAVWDELQACDQPNADGFTVAQAHQSARAPGCQAGAGRRASGLVFAGDVSGGLGRSASGISGSPIPRRLEVRHARRAPEAELYAWLWSPDGPAMDLRHYDIAAHGLDAVYEDVQPGISTATGVARTSELTLFATDERPGKGRSLGRGGAARPGCRPWLVSSSGHPPHDRVSLGPGARPTAPRRYTRHLEDQLERAQSPSTRREVEQRHWYGFWYLWQRDAFLRRGAAMSGATTSVAWPGTTPSWRATCGYGTAFSAPAAADIFRLAEADGPQHERGRHLPPGPLRRPGLAPQRRSRGAAAPRRRGSARRLSEALLLLSDHRRASGRPDATRWRTRTTRPRRYDPMRLAQPPKPPARGSFPARIRCGPDWLAFARQLDDRSGRGPATRGGATRSMPGMDSASRAMPYGIRSGQKPGLRLRSEDRADSIRCPTSSATTTWPPSKEAPRSCSN
jgi:hypothetical protein